MGTIAPLIITNNKIGNILHNSNSNSTSRLHGINVAYFTGSTISINNNIINSLSSSMKGQGNGYTAFTTASLSSVFGIVNSTLSGTLTANDNIIFNIGINSLGTTAAPSVGGIILDGNMSSQTVLRNKIYNLTNTFAGSVANPGNIIGIRLYTSTSTVANNMITLNNGLSTARTRVIGIFDYANNLNLYYNSIAIGGSDSGTTPTAGICSAPYAFFTGSGTHSLRNNIFTNTRTGGSTGNVAHYGIAFTSSIGTATFTSDFNDFDGSGTSNVLFPSTTSITIAAWKTLSTPATPDINSLQITPIFLDLPNGDLHIVATPCTPATLIGTPISTVLTDYDLTVRNITNPVIGAHEYGSPAYTWDGSSWTPTGVPNINSAVTLNGDYDMNIRTSIDACTLTIGNGSNNPIVTVIAGKHLNIQNDLTINTAATLNILDKGSLVMINDAGVVTNNGSTNVLRLTPSFDQFDYTYWSAPVENPQIGTPLAAWNLSQAYNFTTANFSDTSNDATIPQSNNAGSDTFDDDGNDWISVPSTTPMTAGVGYAVMGNATAGTPNSTEIVTFSGKVNNGSITFP